jgi:hypothetical protein
LVSYFEHKSGWNLKGLFDLRPYTRILTWGRQFKAVLKYSNLNKLEARFGSRVRKLANRKHFKPVEDF